MKKLQGKRVPAILLLRAEEEREHFKNCTLELGEQFAKSQAKLKEAKALLRIYANDGEITKDITERTKKALR